MPQPNQLPKLKVVDDPVHQQYLDQIVDTINTLGGYNGEIALSNHINMRGNRVTNVGDPQSPTDAIASAFAASKYSASALAPQIQPSGDYPLGGYRIINSKSQREQLSSYLNDLMSAPPSANGLYPTLTTIGSTVQVSIPPGMFQFADGSTVSLFGRTDILSLPAQYAISAISSSGNVVSCTCAASGLVAGELAGVVGVTPSDFDGVFTLTSSTGGGANLQWQDSLGTLSGSGGFIQTNGTYYYCATKRQQHLTLVGPFSGDTLTNRLNANYDGLAIVVVVVLTASGGQVAQSGGGGSPIVGSPTAGSFF